MKTAHLPKIERRLQVAVKILLPEITNPDIVQLLVTDVPELIDAVREAQGGQRKYCRYCGERRMGLIVASPEDRFVWECRDVDGCGARREREQER